jgi:hypothetical protein
VTLVLKPYKAKPTDRGVGLTCPRKGCGGRFIVNIAQIVVGKRSSGTKTIPCPYCSKVSLIPEGYLEPPDYNNE